MRHAQNDGGKIGTRKTNVFIGCVKEGRLRMSLL